LFGTDRLGPTRWRPQRSTTASRLASGSSRTRPFARRATGDSTAHAGRDLAGGTASGRLPTRDGRLAGTVDPNFSGWRPRRDRRDGTYEFTRSSPGRTRGAIRQTRGDRQHIHFSLSVGRSHARGSMTQRYCIWLTRCCPTTPIYQSDGAGGARSGYLPFRGTQTRTEWEMGLSVRHVLRGRAAPSRLEEQPR